MSLLGVGGYILFKPPWWPCLLCFHWQRMHCYTCRVIPLSRDMYDVHVHLYDGCLWSLVQSFLLGFLFGFLRHFCSADAVIKFSHELCCWGTWAVCSAQVPSVEKPDDPQMTEGHLREYHLFLLGSSKGNRLGASKSFQFPLRWGLSS